MGQGQVLGPNLRLGLTIVHSNSQLTVQMRHNMLICDVIKQNQSEVGNINFEI